MQTSFSTSFLETAQGQEVDKILRSCVHCGFCTATCPTFLLTGNELDSPRGRIYLIKEMLEGGPASVTTQTHLDRCLTCQSCETTCPSNVQYHRLLDIGRAHIEDKVGRSAWVSFKQFLLRKSFSNASLFKLMLTLGRIFKLFLPHKLKKIIPQKAHIVPTAKFESSRKMILLDACVQQALTPQTNAACARVLAKLGIQAVSIKKEGCCGALAYHLNAQEEGLDKARNNIDLFCQRLDQGVEAIISTGSGCGNFIKEYAKLLEHDIAYKDKARRVSEHCKDLSEVLLAEDLSLLTTTKTQKVAFHCPCTLQHGQQLSGSVESILSKLGFTLSPVPDSHLCCGSAGTYSLFQPELSQQLQQNKITALQSNNPDVIVSANVGCQNHLSAVSEESVKHWIEIIDKGLKQ
jgi:glycolate oxidase iron-sulfur subunit